MRFLLEQQGMDVTVWDYAESDFGSIFHFSITVKSEGFFCVPEEFLATF